MSGPRLSCLVVDQLLCVSVVSTDEHHAINLFDCLNCFSNALVDSLDGLDRCVLNACVAYHVRICEVYDDNIIFSGADRVCQLLTNGRCAHLRLKVIGCDLRGLHKDTVLTRIRLLNAAVEEEGNVGIFLCLSNSRLRLPVGSKELTESILDRLFLECDKFVRDRLIVINKAYIGGLDPLRSRKSCKLVITECAGHLSCAVRTEVEEDHGIIVLNGSDGISIFSCHDSRNNELICLSVIVGRLNQFRRGCSLIALACCQCLIRKLHTVPAVITVHRIVTSHNRCHLADTELFHLLL